MDYTCTYYSPLGDIKIACDGECINGLWFDGQKYYASTLSKEHFEVCQEDIASKVPILLRAGQWLDIYFQGQKPDFDLPLKPAGSEFRKSVWEILCQIPYGKTMTYGAIADIIAAERGMSKFSAQAVGNAVGHNPISILIPCHRVIGADGSLTGYAGGLEKKKLLLELEHKEKDL